MSFEVERDWITPAGLRAVVIMGDRGSRCGYVGVPKGHPLYGAEYGAETSALPTPSDTAPIGKRGLITVLCAAVEGRMPRSPEMAFDVHGGITYSGGDDGYPVASDLWWYGYDCAHYGDAPSDEYRERMLAEYPDKPFMWCDGDGIHRALDYCVGECESLASQIAEQTKHPPTD